MRWSRVPALTTCRRSPIVISRRGSTSSRRFGRGRLSRKVMRRRRSHSSVGPSATRSFRPIPLRPGHCWTSKKAQTGEDRVKRIGLVAIALLWAASAQAQDAVTVTAENYNRAESDASFGSVPRPQPQAAGRAGRGAAEPRHALLRGRVRPRRRAGHD